MEAASIGDDVILDQVALGKSFIVVKDGTEVGCLTPFDVPRPVLTPKSAVVERFRGSPPIDGERFRRDFDQRFDPFL